MADLSIKTLEATEDWKSDDGKITAYKLTLEVDGKKAQAYTYSEKIAQVGYAGDVMTYEKNGKTYVKGKPREGFEGGYGGGRPSGGGFKRDDSAIKAQWAIGQAVAINLQSGNPLDFKKIEVDALKVFQMVERVKQGVVPETTTPEASEPLSLEELNNVFPL